MKRAGWITFCYGTLLLVGGIMGHLKAASRASLIAGTLSGVIMLLLALAMFKGKKASLYLAMIGGFLLDAFFTLRFVNTLKFFPSGMMMLVSLLFIFLLALRIRNAAQSRS